MLMLLGYIRFIYVKVCDLVYPREVWIYKRSIERNERGGGRSPWGVVFRFLCRTDFGERRDRKKDWSGRKTAVSSEVLMRVIECS